MFNLASLPLHVSFLHRSSAQVLGQKRELRFYFGHLLFSHGLAKGASFLLHEAEQFPNSHPPGVSGISKRGSHGSVNTRLSGGEHLSSP